MSYKQFKKKKMSENQRRFLSWLIQEKLVPTDIVNMIVIARLDGYSPHGPWSNKFNQLRSTHLTSYTHRN